MQFKLKKIGFMNFQSFGNQMTWITLDENPLTMIRAINMDVGDEGESSNGSGKSACFNAIAYALYGEGVDKVKSDEFINLVNGKKLLVELHFEKEGKSGIIRRGRKPNVLELEYDGTSLTRDSMRNTDDAITAMIGMTYDVFMLTCYMSPNRRTFFEMDGPSQRSVMEQMLSLDVLAARADVVKSIASEVKVDVKVLDREIDILKSSLERSQESLEGHRKKLARDLEDKQRAIEEYNEIISAYENCDLSEIQVNFQKMEEVRQQISEISDRIAENERKVRDVETAKGKLHSLLERKKSQEKKVQGYDDEISEELESLRTRAAEVNVSDLEKSIEHKKATQLAKELAVAIKNVEKEIVRDSHSLAEVMEHISHSQDGTCPVCGGEYVDEGSLARLHKKKETLERELAAQNEELLDLKTEVENVKVGGVDLAPELTVSQCENLIRDMVDVQKEIDRVESRRGDNKHLPLYESILEEIEEYDVEALDEAHRVASEAIVSDMKALSVLEGKTFDLGGFKSERELLSTMNQLETAKKGIDDLNNRESPYLSMVQQSEALVIDDEKALQNAQDDRKQLGTMETHCGYLVKLLTDSKSFVRRRILDNYVPYINKRIVEYSRQMGLTHICELKSDLSMEILYMNRNVSYSLMSRGEKLRLNISTTMAFRDAISLLGKGCNIALVDEFLDSALDGYGIRTGTKFITECAKNVFLITHREDLADIAPAKLTVVKQNGFSSIQ